MGHSIDADVETISDPIPRGTFKPVTIDGAPTYVVFDLETTDLCEYLPAICLYSPFFAAFLFMPPNIVFELSVRPSVSPSNYVNIFDIDLVMTLFFRK